MSYLDKENRLQVTAFLKNPTREFQDGTYGRKMANSEPRPVNEFPIIGTNHENWFSTGAT